MECISDSPNKDIFEDIYDSTQTKPNDGIAHTQTPYK